MKILKTVIATLIAVAVIIPLAGLGIIYSGAYNVAATNEHWPIVERLLNTTVHNSVAARAEGIEVPPLGGRQQVLAGAANYEAMCAGCHAAPGREQGLPGVAMYPQPPRLSHAAEHMTPAQLFWVIKHGIQATGMPSWGPSHSREEMWAMVALIQKFPEMSAAEYQQLQQAADASGLGHHHGHGADSHDDAHAHTAAEGGGDAHGKDAGDGHADDDTGHGPPGHHD